jgi:phosphohistidine swiveling domain-containing protein
VLARELGLPAVVGVRGLLDAVRTGDTVEVDAAAGVVRGQWEWPGGGYAATMRRSGSGT